MGRTITIKVGALLIFLLFWGAKSDAKTLVIGRVSDNPARHHQELKPILDYVVGHLKDLGITDGSVRLAKDAQEMIRLLREGKVDWVTKGVFQAILYSQQTGAEIALRRWRKGTATYHTVLFTRKDSGIRSLNDLRGKKMAFEDRGSTSAYFVPVAILRRAGIELAELSSPREEPPADRMGYAFAGGELNISTWVHKGLTDAGAYHNQNWEDPQENPRNIREDLKIFYRGRSLPRMVEVLRKDLDPRIKARVKKVLMKAHQDPAAKKALKRYSETARFDEFKGEARRGLKEAKRLLKYFHDEFK